ncbi:polysaccharide deacetylase family protein [Constantimarinum furrinae]|uniref:Polysaccharide deacetylase n=1 Tax=Constantimarinum furrinae TaxID=2562285 RepID=A0A7G8PTW0_9FLAO|nr:polysaccharide deacetylase family protein [Constantimarinum furrinae]QNJ97776.1 polysaccharide deacetylase [Constantimarinum furrinae]
MNSLLVKSPKLLHRMFPKRVWAVPKETKNVYLTFDDGPIPEVTPWVLELLRAYHAQATFFCIGNNIQKHPALLKRIIVEGHTIGNHTFHHLNGWQTESSKYLTDVLMAEAEIEALSEGRREQSESQKTTTKKLFRPPYGKLTGKQSRILQKKGYHIIMWSVLSGDFNAKLSEEKCLQNVIKNIRPGSIVVFHDSVKSEKNLRYVLPKVLDFLNKNHLVSKGL